MENIGPIVEDTTGYYTVGASAWLLTQLPFEEWLVLGMPLMKATMKSQLPRATQDDFQNLKMTAATTVCTWKQCSTLYKTSLMLPTHDYSCAWPCAWPVSPGFGLFCSLAVVSIAGPLSTNVPCKLSLHDVYHSNTQKTQSFTARQGAAGLCMACLTWLWFVLWPRSRLHCRSPEHKCTLHVFSA
jgi:hypothetical protein